MPDRWSKIPRIEDLHLYYDTSRLPRAGEIVYCLMCAKPFLMKRYEGTPDQICPECWALYDECARVVCWKCKVVVARVKPGVTDTGFHVRRRAVLHLDRCNICGLGPPDASGLQYATVIEIEQWEKSIGRTGRLWVPIGFKPKDK